MRKFLVYALIIGFLGHSMLGNAKTSIVFTQSQLEQVGE